MATTTAPDDSADALRVARKTLRVERRRVVDEREAFEAFRSRVRRIPTETDPRGPVPHGWVRPSGPGATTGFGVDGRIGRTRPTGNGLVAVRDAYVETVISVPHYEEEYDDTYETSLAVEFGPDLAVALTQEPTLHDRYKRSLLSGAETAIEERETFLETLDVETASVDDAAERLCSILEETVTLARSNLDDLGFGTLDAYRARTVTLEENCDAVASRRQREIAGVDRTMRLDDAVPDVASYLYGDLSVTHPVLSTVATVGSRLRDLRREIEREMTRSG